MKVDHFATNTCTVTQSNAHLPQTDIFWGIHKTPSITSVKLELIRFLHQPENINKVSKTWSEPVTTDMQTLRYLDQKDKLPIWQTTILIFQRFYYTGVSSHIVSFGSWPLAVVAFVESQWAQKLRFIFQPELQLTDWQTLRHSKRDVRTAILFHPVFTIWQSCGLAP